MKNEILQTQPKDHIAAQLQLGCARTLNQCGRPANCSATPNLCGDFIGGAFNHEWKQRIATRINVTEKSCPNQRLAYGGIINARSTAAKNTHLLDRGNAMESLTGHTIGRYVIQHELGHGGMATVYLAYDISLRREVAIKFIRRSAFSAEVWERMHKRFEREAHALALLDNDHIVKIYDYGEHEGAPYLVMQYIAGGTLKQQMEGRTETPLTLPLEPLKAARLILPIAHALAHAHEKGILHRDIKPANILITKHGKSLLSDFGIAKILDDTPGTTMTSTGEGVGTAEYMAPEQGRGNAVPQSDIYSLGIVLYELVTGRKPFTGNTPVDILLKHAMDSLPPPRQYVPDLAVEVEQMLQKALAKRPEERYTSMNEFAAVLEELTAQPAKAGIERRDPKIAGQVSKPDSRVSVPESVVPGGMTREDDASVGARQKGTSKMSRSPLASPSQYASQTARRAEETFDPLAAGAGAHSGSKRRAHVPLPKWAWGLIALGAIGVMAVILFSTGGRAASPAPTQTAVFKTSEVLKTSEVSSAPTRIYTPLPTHTPAPSLTPTLGIGSTMVFEKDGMTLVYVPAGEFLMGSDPKNDQQASYGEMPQHTVNLDAYWIDQTEVTNAMYAQCAAAGACEAPKPNSTTRSSYYGNPEYDDYPVLAYPWGMAHLYCQWAGRRLPSEAEWEKAARGAGGLFYPWGDQAPDCDLTNITGCIGDTARVGSHPQDASPYGVLDMAGNVFEWTADWYSATFYTNSPVENPSGPEGGEIHLVRGGAWRSDVSDVRSASRSTGVDGYWNFDDLAVGVRCALSAAP